MSDPLVHVPPGQDAWATLQALAVSVDQVITFEHEVRPRPPLVCEPEEVDWEWSVPSGPMGDDMDEPLQCRVHRDEWWPCQAFREGRGVREQGSETVQVLTMKPRETR